MSFWTMLDGGLTLPGKTRRHRLAFWIGRYLARRHGNVSFGRDCCISPRAMIHPRKAAIRMGDDCQVGPYAIVQGAVTLGDHSSIQAFTVIVGSGSDAATTGVTIGNNVRIAPYVMILSADHVFADRDTPIRLQGMNIKPVVIEDDVWIAGRVNITAGVRIGRGSVIGAGAVVTHDIPPYSVAVGVPARVIKSR